MTDKIYCAKAVKKSGHSLCLYITKEAKELGLEHGDYAFVMLTLPESGKNKTPKEGEEKYESK